MRNTVLVTAMLMVMGPAIAAPAPVEDIAGGFNDDRIAKLERILKAKQQSEFDMQRRLDALQAEVLDLRGLSEQQQYQIEQMLQRQRQLYEDIANLSTQSVASNPSTVVEEPSVAAVASTLGETATYEAAVNLVLKERKYEEAIPAFSDFIAQYPQSSYAANANYWLGQLLFNKGSFAEAKGAFVVVVEKYPNSSKRGDSLVKLGMIAEKQNDNAGAKALYNKVMKEYPDSASARLAKQQLATL